MHGVESHFQSVYLWELELFMEYPSDLNKVSMAFV